MLFRKIFLYALKNKNKFEYTEFNLTLVFFPNKKNKTKKPPTANQYLLFNVRSISGSVTQISASVKVISGGA